MFGKKNKGMKRKVGLEITGDGIVLTVTFYCYIPNSWISPLGSWSTCSQGIEGEKDREYYVQIKSNPFKKMSNADKWLVDITKEIKKIQKIEQSKLKTFRVLEGTTYV